MKKYFLIILSISSILIATAQPIELYVECQKSAQVKMCRSFWEVDPEGKNPEPKDDPSFEMKAAMQFNSDDVESAQILKEDPAEFRYQKGVTLYLNKSAARKFAELTKANIGKRLGMVYAGKLLSAPVIQSEIETGNVQITSEKDFNDPFGKVVWLSEKIYDEEKNARQARTTKYVAYFFLAILALGASLHYAFSRTKKPSKAED